MQKIFSFDLGVRNATLNNFTDLRLRDDAGRLFENFVFLELKKKYENVFFFRTTQGTEVDFVYLENGLNITYKPKYLH